MGYDDLHSAGLIRREQFKEYLHSTNVIQTSII